MSKNLNQTVHSFTYKEVPLEVDYLTDADIGNTFTYDVFDMRGGGRGESICQITTNYSPNPLSITNDMLRKYLEADVIAELQNFAEFQDENQECPLCGAELVPGEDHIHTIE